MRALRELLLLLMGDNCWALCSWWKKNGTYQQYTPIFPFCPIASSLFLASPFLFVHFETRSATAWEVIKLWYTNAKYEETGTPSPYLASSLNAPLKKRKNKPVGSSRISVHPSIHQRTILYYTSNYFSATLPSPHLFGQCTTLITQAIV